MNFRERMLYHQIHPAKLGTDLIAEVISAYFFWRHELLTGLVLHFLPPALTSAALLFGPVDLTAQRDSAFGAYLRDTMTRAVEAARLAGDAVIAIGAWERSAALIGLGGALVALAWLSGLAPRSHRR